MEPHSGRRVKKIYVTRKILLDGLYYRVGFVLRAHRREKSVPRSSLQENEAKWSVCEG